MILLAQANLPRDIESRLPPAGSVPASALAPDSASDLAAQTAALPAERGQLLLDWLGLGGPVVWILIGLATIALSIVLLKTWQFMVVGVGRAGPVRHALGDWHGDNAAEVLQQLEGRSDPASIVVAQALAGVSQGFDDELVREECQRLGNAHLERLRLLLRPLAFIGTVAPLLGLLGTVIGMIVAFQGIQQAGSQVDPAVLSGGIWAALLTTAVGLAVAIPVTMAHSWLERRLERLAHRIEDAVAFVFTIRLKRIGQQAVRSPSVADYRSDDAASVRSVIGVVKPGRKPGRDRGVASA